MLLEGALLMWFFLTLLSLIYLTYALIYHTPSAWVMKLAWFLVILYTGPIGLFIYLLSCKEPLPGMHEKYIQFRWKQSLGSEIHCLAGDATGIIIAAIILSFFTISALTEMILEYIAGFVCGLLIFQALFMKAMMGGSYWKAIKGTFISEWLSMNMIMAGMIPVMFVWRFYDANAENPATLSFWGSMSLAAIVGGILAYPINDWLVTQGLKHGMMTIDTSPEAAATTPQKELMSHAHHDKQKTPVSRSKLIVMTLATLIILIIGIAIGLIWSR